MSPNLSKLILATGLLLTGSMVHAEDMIFEEINVIRSKFEGVGELLNTGDGSFYGSVTWTPSYRGGAVFRVAPNQEPELIHAFDVVEDFGPVNAGGAGPSARLVEGPDGAMYGATKYGGAYGAGTIYRITSAGAFSVVHHLQPGQGYVVNCLAWAPDGSLYGTGSAWKATPEPHVHGILFRIDPQGAWETVYNFPRTTNASTEPSDPVGVAVGSDGGIYGITRSGGVPVQMSELQIVSHGTFFRYDEPGEITVLGNFGEEKEHPLFMTPADGGFYVTTYGDLTHFTNNGTHTLLADFDAAGKGTTASTVSSVLTEDGFFGITNRGGENGAGFVYRYTPGEGVSYLHEMAMDYRARARGLALGNDGQIYGFAGFPEGEFGPTFSASDVSAKAGTPKAGAKDTGKGKSGRAFRFRKASASANLVPVAKPDTAWLPAKATDGKREVLIKVLANDRDANRGDKLTITSVGTVSGGTVEIVTAAKGAQSLRFTTTAADPLGAEFTYEVSDGHGGTATGSVTVLVPASGKFTGTTTSGDLDAPLSIVVSKKNGVSAVFTAGGRKYSGKGKLGSDDSAELSLKSKGQTPYTLQLDLERGAEREFTATLANGTLTYTGTCAPVPPKK